MVRDTVTGGAQLLVVQTNNATFDEAEAASSWRWCGCGRSSTAGDGADGLHGRGVRRSSTPDGRRARRRPGSTPGRSWSRQLRLDDGTYAGHPARARGRSWRSLALAVAALAGACGARRRQRSRPDGTAGDADATEEPCRGDRRRSDAPDEATRAWPGAGGHPDLQRGRQHRADRRAGPARRAGGATSSSPTTTARTAPARIADELAAADAQVHVLHRPGKEGLGAAYLAGFALGARARLRRGRGDGRRRLARARRSCRRCWTRSRDADVVLGSRWVPGGSVRQLADAPAAALPRRQPVLAAGAGHAGQGRDRRLPGVPDAGRWTRSTSTTVASQGYCFQVELAVAGVPARVPDRRGADHVRRAGARRQQDELLDRAGGVVAGDRVGNAIAPARR